MPSRSGRGRRAGVDFLVCFGCGGITCYFRSFFELRTDTAENSEAGLPHFEAQSRNPYILGFLRRLHNEARPRERSDRGSFLPLGLKSLIPGCVQGVII